MLSRASVCRACQLPAHAHCVALIAPTCEGQALTKRERRDRAVEVVWSKFDRNNGGSLTFHELTALGMSADDAALFFRAFDRDGSHRIEKAEFAKLVERHFLPVFRVFDPNDDGSVLVSDLKVRMCVFCFVFVLCGFVLFCVVLLLLTKNDNKIYI